MGARSYPPALECPGPWRPEVIGLREGRSVFKGRGTMTYCPFRKLEESNCWTHAHWPPTPPYTSAFHTLKWGRPHSQTLTHVPATSQQPHTGMTSGRYLGARPQENQFVTEARTWLKQLHPKQLSPDDSFDEC